MDKAASWLEQTLQFQFSDERLLKTALTHRSAGGVNNERLEFLGDAVLQLVVSELIFGERSEASEGRLSRLRSTLVKDATLGDLGAEIGLGEHLILGPGEKKSGGHRRASILADTLEALFGAIYLDAGLEAARSTIRLALQKRIEGLSEGAELRDPKSRLQENLQGQKLELPAYAIESVSGKAHRQSFVASCTIAQLDLQTSGAGTTRRDAEQEAALAMLQLMDASE
ncbi:MAG: ribonuclease III [Woeseiaceae bacterium]